MLQNQQFDQLMEIQRRQATALESLAATAQQLAMSTIVTAPNYEYPLENFATFDWGSIGASIERVDKYGVAVVCWRGWEFIRRSPPNKFGEAIWFSRCVGKGESGENKYERLVSFRPVSKIMVEPLPQRVEQLVHW